MIKECKVSVCCMHKWSQSIKYYLSTWKCIQYGKILSFFSYFNLLFNFLKIYNTRVKKIILIRVVIIEYYDDPFR